MLTRRIQQSSSSTDCSSLVRQTTRPLRTLVTVSRGLSPAIDVRTHLEPYALQARLACPQQPDRYPAHPVEYFAVFFDKLVQIGGYLIAMCFQLFLLDLCHFVFPLLVLIPLQRLTLASGAYPFQRLAFMALIVGSYLWVHEHSDRADQPMLPIMPDDDCDAIYLLLVAFDESSMIFECRDIVPAVEAGGINQQPNLAVLIDNRIDQGSNLAKVVGRNFIRH
jgi:hypothetical protein